MSAELALARQCADDIKAYWRERGAHVMVDVKYMLRTGNLSVATIRSDMRNGLPKGWVRDDRRRQKRLP